MKVTCKIIMTVIFSILTLTFSFQTWAVDIYGGSGNEAEKLILDWAKYKPGKLEYSVKFGSNISSSDLGMLQKSKIDFTILDSPLSEAELARQNFVQFPFALSGLSIVVNLPNSLAGTLKLDSQIIGKIFSGEITSWDDQAITALNPKHDLPSEPIIIVHSGETSTDYPIINSYLGDINEKWKSGDSNKKTRVWPVNSIIKDGFSKRISALQHTSYSIGFLPMQFMSQHALANVHIKNKDGNFVGLSDKSIIASTSNVNIDGGSDNLSLINKSGPTTWPISNFTFIVVHRDRIKEDKIVFLLNVINFGLKYGSLKSTMYNYVALPKQFFSHVIARIDTLTGASSNVSTEVKLPPQIANQDNSAALEEKRKIEETSRAEEISRAARKLSDDRERDQAIKEAKAARLAAEEAIQAAKSAKVEADALSDKNRLIAKIEKDRLAKEQAEKESIAKEQAERKRAIDLRNQKDEDPVEAYRRSLSSQ